MLFNNFNKVKHFYFLLKLLKIPSKPPTHFKTSHHSPHSKIPTTFTILQPTFKVFQDVHIMMFIGFGFLMTFLKRYGFSSVGFNFLIAAFVIQWQTLISGFINSFDGSKEGIIRVDVETLAFVIYLDFIFKCFVT